jgi:hypothetical protein
MARSSFFVSGGRDPEDRKTSWEPKVNKDPFHRTMDIFNGVFKKHVKLSAGPTNSTDLHTIYINFGEFRPSKIVETVRPGADSDHAIFLLECGHEWEGRVLAKDLQPKKVGDWGMCALCGADTAYRGFEHEWQHIIFKSDLAARVIFCEQYADQLLRQAPTGSVSKHELVTFLHMLVNAFDDIRVNSLWEKVYPGSATAIWDRWRYFAARMENINNAFLPFIFAVAFDIPTNPQGEFEPMRPVIDWALKAVKYRGFNNMLLDVRVVMDRCMGALLTKMKPPAAIQPPPPPSLMLPAPPTPSPGGSGQQQDKEEKTDGEELGNSNGYQENKEADQDQSQANQKGGEEDQETDADQGQTGSGSDAGNQQAVSSGQESQRDQEGGGAGKVDQEDNSSSGGLSGRSSLQQLLGGVPSATDVSATEADRSNALARLMQDPNNLDSKEEHALPTPEDLITAQKSQALRAALNRVLHMDLSDLEDLESPSQGEPDADMQAQIDVLQSGVAQKNESSQLTDGARAKVTIINVTSEGKGRTHIEIGPDERVIIQRLRAAFLRSMGKQKAKRSSVGTSVDVESLIQYLGDHQDSDIFQNEDVNQGFAYSVVCDMSGSMSRCFPVVCQAVEMLKQALDFPFVAGNLWGFRGGQPLTTAGGKNARFGGGEVWMYRYEKDVDWYTGTVPLRIFPGPNGIVDVPVECGGITPMNSAINIATSHLWRKMPAGMAKRMFLLTDGSPMQVKVTGRQISEFILRQFVANEIAKARKHGIEVYTLVIGDHAISDEKCQQMFGQKKFWRKVGQDRVGTVLLTLVLQNFTRYLRRG